ncbi:unnamed protein product [Porites lobata]|uniref:Dynein axonemal assembly factor 4 n=1 Tax=Porites lobata TaxID=104759 RepID=A0ABN8QRE9_9CNID|nr:unnamed protein product [Porites lobata]
MPIQVKDFVWEETDETVLITVPLKGVPIKRVDIFSVDDYIKVSYPPYLFEAFLYDEVEDTKSKATFGNGIITFHLVKRSPVQWNHLLAPESEDKDFMKRRREEAINKAHDRAKKEKEQKAAEKREQEKVALREQMKIEQEERAKIDAIKEEERKKATEAIERWKENQKLHVTQEIETSKEVHLVMDDNKDSELEFKDEKPDIKETKVVESDGETQMMTSYKPAVKVQPSHNNKRTTGKKKEMFDKPVPEPRSGGSISVSFTPRVFKTAARESKAPEEEEWLKKMASAGRKTDYTNSDAIDMEEMNPIWLKDKGIGFYKVGNYVAAINAFTAAIVLDGSIPSLYSNRAACHLQLKQYKECAQDCTSALELLVPPVQANSSSRCKAYVRRGTAFMQMEEYVLALEDYESALKLDPQNADLRRDSDRIRNIIQGTT